MRGHRGIHALILAVVGIAAVGKGHVEHAVKRIVVEAV